VGGGIGWVVGEKRGVGFLLQAKTEVLRPESSMISVSHKGKEGSGHAPFGGFHATGCISRHTRSNFTCKHTHTHTHTYVISAHCGPFLAQSQWQI